MAFERFAAFDGRGKSPQDYPEYNERKALAFYARPMSGGEVGCYMSHLLCAKAIKESGLDHAIVLEDDMTINEKSKVIIEALVKKLDKEDPDWEVVNIGRHAHKLSTTLATINGIDVQRAHYFPVTTTGLVWSKKGAAAFWDTHQEIYAPVDHFFRYFFSARGTGYSLNPPLVQTSGAESDIDDEGDATSNARDRLRRTPLYLWREFRRQSTNYWNAWRHLKRHRPPQ